jgi:hypothetical protein
MLPLTIRPASESAFQPDTFTEVHAWRDLSGAVCARGYVGAGMRWMRWPGVVTFCFDDRGCIDAFPESGIAPAQVTDLCRRSVEPIVRQALGWEALHASGVRSDAGVLAFCGERESGKSTLAYSLARRGFSQYADDAIVMRVDGTRVVALDLSFGVRLRPEPARLFGFDAPQSQPLHDVLPLNMPAGDETTTPLCALFVLGRHASGPPSVTRLAPGAAFTAILAHAHCFDPVDPAGRQRLLENYLAIADSLPVFQLRFASGLDGLDAVLDTIEDTAGVRSPVRCR